MFKLCYFGHQFSFIIPIIIIKYKYIEIMSSFLVVMEFPSLKCFDNLMIHFEDGIRYGKTYQYDKNC